MLLGKFKVPNLSGAHPYRTPVSDVIRGGFIDLTIKVAQTLNEFGQYCIMLVQMRLNWR